MGRYLILAGLAYLPARLVSYLSGVNKGGATGNVVEAISTFGAWLIFSFIFIAICAGAFPKTPDESDDQTKP